MQGTLQHTFELSPISGLIIRLFTNQPAKAAPRPKQQPTFDPNRPLLLAADPIDCKLYRAIDLAG